MTKEQKILLLFVLAIAGGAATFYITRTDSSEPTTLQETDVTSTSSNEGVRASPQSTGGSGSVNVSNQAPKAPKTPISTTPKQPVVPTAPVTPPVTATSRTPKEITTYSVPNGDQEEITVTVVVDGAGIITDVTFAHATPTNRESREYLGKFSSTFKSSLVVGKKIEGLSVSRVGGASLTTKAFNKALVNLSANL